MRTSQAAHPAAQHTGLQAFPAIEAKTWRCTPSTKEGIPVVPAYLGTHCQWESDTGGYETGVHDWRWRVVALSLIAQFLARTFPLSTPD